MPFIKLKTNCAVPAATADTIQKHLGLAITAIPGKTADWLMVEVEDNRQLFFRGTNEPAAIAEVSLYGNASANGYAENSHRSGICQLCHDRTLGLEWIEFLGGHPKRHVSGFVSTHPKTKSRNRMAWILRNLSHFDFFPKNLKKGLTNRSRCDIIKTISNSRKECERRNIYLKVE